jgi:predicted DNA-binding WGR domain protein
MPKQYFEFKDDRTNKFWEVDYDDNQVVIRYGKVGTLGQVTTREVPDFSAALNYASKAIREKVKKGYKISSKPSTKEVENKTKKNNVSQKKQSLGNGPKKNSLELNDDEVIFYGNMKWWGIDTQPQSFLGLPDEFETAFGLFKKNKKIHMDEIIHLLTPFIVAKFLPSNISCWEEIFKDPEGDGCPEFDGYDIKIVGIDFKKTPIPLVKSEAFFKVPMKKEFKKFTEEQIQEWQETNDFFFSGLSFGWNLPECQSVEDLDLMQADHQGCECIVSAR